MVTTAPVSAGLGRLGVHLTAHGRVDGHSDLDNPRVDTHDARVAANAAPPGPLTKWRTARVRATRQCVTHLTLRPQRYSPHHFFFILGLVVDTRCHPHDAWPQF